MFVQRLVMFHCQCQKAVLDQRWFACDWQTERISQATVNGQRFGHVHGTGLISRRARVIASMLNESLVNKQPAGAFAEFRNGKNALGAFQLFPIESPCELQWLVTFGNQACNLQGLADVN